MPYSAFKYAIALGFTEEEAQALQACKCGAGASPQNILRIARVKGLPSTKEDYPKPPPADLLPEAPQPMPSTVASVVKGKAPAKRRKTTKRRMVKER